MELALAIPVGLLLAYANGANDNFKGVATLFGSGTTSYSSALVWATITTLAGSTTALIMARGLLAAFSGKGLVPPELVADPRFPMAVALAAAATVLLATRLGFPISTTHALIGGLIGAGLIASPSGINVSKLGTGFVLPLLSSPIVAILGTLVLYPPLKSLRKRSGIKRESCVCVGSQVVAGVPSRAGAAQVMTALTMPTIIAGTTTTCRARYHRKFLGISARRALDAAHYLSAGVVSFARGLNDTPKIAALLLAGNLIAPKAAILGVAAVIGVGGLVGARRVAETMSHRITAMNSGQGFVANIVTGLLVVGASILGLPVSTTHVSCGSLFGIGTATRQGRWKMIREILLAWIITIPVAAVLGALAMSVL